MTEDVKEIVLELGSQMIKLAGKGDNIEENKQQILEYINSKKALEKFKQLVKNQGGDESYIDDTSKFESAKFIIPVYAINNGFIKNMDNEKIGYIAAKLGAGRAKKEDKINNRVGIIIEKKIGSKVDNNDIIAYIHADDYSVGIEAVKELQACYEFSKEPVEKEQSILGVIK